MNNILYSLAATLLVSIISFVGILGILLKEKLLNRILLWLVGFSAGALIGGAFLHLIPEALEEGAQENFFVFILLGFIIFFILEKALFWHHCHKHAHEGRDCGVKTFGYMNLIGDGLHNLIDGIVIAASFSVDVSLGIATTIAVIAHEVPQEISDFGVLVYGGFSKAKALLFNFVSALLAVVGAIAGVYLISALDDLNYILIGITAGGFIYISASDLIPEINKEGKTKKSIISLAFFLIGIGFMYWIKGIFE
ncbi:ZIP family metal transporter [Candidatus Falkowbacteria bacterium]|nr:ZIP family metal transporter [Candidatus Falkowbacteria bacterium]